MPPQTAPGSLVQLTSVERALKQSLQAAPFRDVHLYAFSRRSIARHDGTVRIGHPLPIVGIGAVLKEAEYFGKLLTSGFSESDAAVSPASIRRYAFVDEYDYESDSDLDEAEVDDHCPEPAVATEDDDSPRECPATPAPAVDRASGDMVPRRILLPNVAYQTLLACVFYLYTEKANFLPLSSAGMTDRQLALLTTGEADPPPCSPKSMYRLAESYGMTKLQELAFQAIVSRITVANVVDEAFSPFFSRYDRLREHAVSYISRNYTDPKVQVALQDALDKVLLGQLPHAGGLLRSLLGLRITVKPPGGPTPSILTQESWEGMQKQRSGMKSASKAVESNSSEEPRRTAPLPESFKKVGSKRA
ncbi:hypothetical protein C8Q77DRAFT_1050083 [Trametes polyzona]|nr:hypothetical protein C8Q77DRAFT_1050083 [Trametes polyzona]